MEYEDSINENLSYEAFGFRENGDKQLWLQDEVYF